MEAKTSVELLKAKRDELEQKCADLERQLSESDLELRLAHSEYVNAALAEKSLEFGFELKADMRITCTPEMHEYAEEYYLKLAPNRKTRDLADYHFPLGYSDMRLAKVPTDVIFLQGYGTSITFPPDMVKRAVEGKS